MASEIPPNALLHSYSVIAITLAAGANLSTTIISIFSIQISPSLLLAKQWKFHFDNGIVPAVTLSMSYGAGFAILAGLTHVSKGALMQRNLYIGAAEAALGIAPYTQLLMGKNIEMLEKRAKEGKGDGKYDTHALVPTWGRYSFWMRVMLLN